MYTRITTGRFDAARAQELQDIVAQAVANAARDLPGFKSYNGGLDRSAGRLAAVTTWETEAQARGFRDQLSREVMQQITDAGVQLDDSQIFETVVSV
jgi:heme-degrading monooxygenase HmoA